MSTSKSKSKSNPLTTPTIPIALNPHHLLSPPADLLTNTATTLTITPTQETKPSSPAFTVHRIRAHEPPDSPDRSCLLYNVYGKPWPNTSRVICDTEGVSVLVLRRAWLSRKWAARSPDQNQDLLVASVPWTVNGPGSKVGVGAGVGGGGFRLEVRFVNALAVREGSEVVGGGVGGGVSGVSGVSGSDEPPPYSAVSAVGGEEGDAGVVQRDEKVHPLHPLLPNSHSGSPMASTQRHTQHPHSPSLLPSYDSVRRDSPNPLRDLLDALEPPQEPAPAVLFPVSASVSASASASASASRNTSTSSSSSPADAEANAAPGSKMELRVMHQVASGTSVMMGNQKIMHITRHNSMDYSKSKMKLRPRWEVEVSEGVDLLLVSFPFGFN
ncbi:hypothetical protein VN97_g2071 [Penicillium thymicola]|uniref:Uncharacterized protein n=1 Tax=Penicillium thymicola TaxID=293382 RepID=A0AAI9TQK7_PENTH|nr:hypothetical protein VN97_g2071 [Penicillium thymicola]